MDGGNFRNRYSEAYGNYQGGYGPKGGFNFQPPPPPPRFGMGRMGKMGGPPGNMMGGPPDDMMGGPPGNMMRGPPGNMMRGPRGMMGGPPRNMMDGPSSMMMGPMSGPPPLMGPRGPPPFGPPFRNNYGPMRPHNPMKFLTKCGVNPDNLKNVPKSVLRLYLPNHCGVCRMDFDTFSFARMHYTSKNHLKNQRKWLNDSGTGGPHEMALKSRDLYCELCDIQITSKQHADSHYSGKNHRAVVEGRKRPKNAKLLQSGSEARLEKLIKREMKFLKADEAAHNAAAAAGSNDGETTKPVSEFYCDICKSSMSCSDQMTAHMNGKKHLAKEKQHILRMMKGNTNGGAAVQADEEATDAGATGAVEANGNGAGGDKASDGNDDNANEQEMAGEEDWVNGTGEGWETTQTEA